MSFDDNSKVPLREGKTLLSKVEVKFVSKISLTVQSMGCAGSSCKVIAVPEIYLKKRNCF